MGMWLEGAFRRREQFGGKGWRKPRRVFRRPSVPDEGSRPDDEGQAAGNGFSADARQSGDGRYVSHVQDAYGWAQYNRAYDNARSWWPQFRRKSRRLHYPKSMEHRLHDLRFA